MSTFLRLLIGSMVIIVLFSINGITSSNQPPIGRTGAPGEQTCNSAGCHSSLPLESDAAYLTMQNQGSSIFNLGYEEGVTYNLAFTNSFSSPVKGFQLTALDQSANATGTFSLSNPSSTTLANAGGRQYVGHNNASAVNAWAFQWQAPASGPDTVIFYAASCAANGDGGTSGDRIGLKQFKVFKKPPLPIGPCEDLFMSEYIEGSSFNKGIELYNPTANAIDLNNYFLQLYRNGSPSATDVSQLTGTIQPYSTFLITNPGATGALAANSDLTLGSSGTGPVSFNGDDAIALLSLAGDTVDVFGVVGQDPGSQWSTGGVSSQNQTLVRKFYIKKGVKATGGSFDPSLEWDSYAQDFFDSTATHFNACIPDFCTIYFDAIVDSVKDVSCNGGSDGEVYYSVNFGSGSYQLSAATAALSAGTYSITLEDTLVGCIDTLNFTITEPAPLSLTAASDSVSCFGGSDGTAIAIASGGTLPYQYSIDGGSTYQLSDTINSLAAGSYTVDMLDANGCAASVGVTVLQPADITVNLVQDSVSCFGESNGSIATLATGGTAPYEYSIDGSNFVNTPNFPGLSAGNYTITVRDLNLCTKSANIDVLEPDTLSFTTTEMDVTCNGNNDGSITITATGGTSPYEYSSNNGTTFVVTNSFSNLAPGTYNLVVRDLNQCIATSTVTIAEPTALTIALAADSVSCGGGNDGAITATAAGGNLAYQFSIDGNTFVSGNTFNNLSAGTYSITVQDGNGCTASATSTVEAPFPLSATTNSENVSCSGNNDGKAWVTVQFGILPYNYNWSSSGSTTDTATGLAPGTYTVTITDGNGCTLAASETVVQDITPVQPGTINGPDTICADGLTDEYFVAGLNGITYSWTTSGGGSFTSNGDSLAAFEASTEGDYTISVTPQNTCGSGLAQTKQITIVRASQPLIAGDTTVCIDDVATYSVTNPDPYTSYSWNTISGLFNNTGTSVTDTWDTVGTQTITVVGFHAYCPTGVLVDDLDVEVKPDLIADFTYTIDTGTNTVSFTNTSVNTEGNETYNWDFDNSNSSVAQSPTEDFGLSADGVYTISMTITGNCNSDTYSEDINLSSISTGVNTVLNAASVAVYPNPTYGMLHVEWPAIKGELQIVVTNVLGEELRAITEDAITGRSTISLADLPDGVYMLTMGSGTDTFVQKIVKH